ncbi:MAG: hypothetical protein KGN01_08090 [Patescibacteria group bacterium]|nr:hypothetical protein [Patescibacteria group bacterium]
MDSQYSRVKGKNGVRKSRFLKDLDAHNRVMQEAYLNSGESNIGSTRDIRWIEKNYPDFQLATDSQDVTFIYNDVLTSSEQERVRDDYPDLDGFSFFVAPDQGSVWVFSGTVPEYSKMATRIR